MANAKGEKRKRLKLARKRYLWEQQEGKCCYCREPMIHWEDIEDRRGDIPRKMATLEHIYPRRHPRRLVPPVGREKRWSLACRDCNEKKGAEYDSSLGIPELQRLSRLHRRRQVYGTIDVARPAMASSLAGRAVVHAADPEKVEKD